MKSITVETLLAERVARIIDNEIGRLSTQRTQSHECTRQTFSRIRNLVMQLDDSELKASIIDLIDDWLFS